MNLFANWYRSGVHRQHEAVCKREYVRGYTYKIVVKNIIYLSWHASKKDQRQTRNGRAEA